MPSIIPRGVPFAQIPHDLICDPDLSHASVRVYCYLMRRADGEGRAFPGLRRIGRETGMSPTTARKSVDILEAAGWLEVARERNESGEWRVNQYVIHGVRVYQELVHPVPVVVSGGVPAASTELHPDLTTSTELVAATPRNEYWDVAVHVFGEPSNGQRSLYGRFVAMVKDGGFRPEDIYHRAARLAALWGHDKVTVASLEKHWSRFDAAIGQVTDADVEAFTAGKDREAMLERLADE